MGCTKQLLPWPTPDGDKPIVAAAFDAIVGVCDHMLVIVGHEAGKVTAALGDRAFQAVTADPDADMFESIRAGLEAARSLDAPGGALIHPADHPQVTRATLDAMLETLTRSPDRAVIPEHGGRGGHPVLVPECLFQQLLEFSGAGGLRRYWIDHAETVERLPVNDPSILRDLDTPNGLPSP